MIIVACPRSQQAISPSRTHPRQNRNTPEPCLREATDVADVISNRPESFGAELPQAGRPIR